MRIEQYLFTCSHCVEQLMERLDGKQYQYTGGDVATFTAVA